MGANIAGIYGAQIFRADDKPKYRRGFSIGIGVLAFGVVVAAVRYVDDVVRRRRNGGKLETVAESDGSSQNVDQVVDVVDGGNKTRY